MKWKMILFLTVVLAVLTLVIHGNASDRPELVQLGLGCLALYVVFAWLIPALRGDSPVSQLPDSRGKARPSWEHSLAKQRL